MSLLTTASVWTNDSSAKPKKRIPTMHNAILKQQDRSNPQPVLEDVGGQNVAEATLPPGMAEAQSASSQRTARIHELLNNMDEDGAALANFEPLDHPILQKRVEDEKAAMQIPTSNLRPVSDTPFHPYPTNAAAVANYHQMYENAPTVYRPPPLPSVSAPPPHDRWMEKMNYVIYLLEQQQNEKTNHITEEFVLYTFLGVFVIFVVDAFSRGGKYVR
jgi:hypothetical protein